MRNTTFKTIALPHIGEQSATVATAEERKLRVLVRVINVGVPGHAALIGSDGKVASVDPDGTASDAYWIPVLAESTFYLAPGQQLRAVGNTLNVPVKVKVSVAVSEDVDSVHDR